MVLLQSGRTGAVRLMSRSANRHNGAFHGIQCWESSSRQLTPPTPGARKSCYAFISIDQKLIPCKKFPERQRSYRQATQEGISR